MLAERTNLQPKKEEKAIDLNGVQFSMPHERERRGASETEREGKKVK